MLKWTSALAVLAMAGALCAIAYQDAHAHRMPELSTPYQAVALMNGQSFYGRIDQMNADYIVLRDVFYIQSQQNPQAKQVSNVLIKRAGDWHAPDRMILNRHQVQFIEPVKEDSPVAKLIAEQNNKDK